MLEGQHVINILIQSLLGIFQLFAGIKRIHFHLISLRNELLNLVVLLLIFPQFGKLFPYLLDLLRVCLTLLFRLHLNLTNLVLELVDKAV